MLRPYLRLLVFAALFLVSSLARAQDRPREPGGACDGVGPCQPARAPLGLVVFGAELPRESLRAGLERELGRPVVLVEGGARAAGPFVTVTWRKERSELAVSYDEPGRGTVSRVVRARPLPAQNVEDAIVLASNLARNEADELLGKPPAPPAPATPPSAAHKPGREPAPATPRAPAPQPEPAKRDFVPAYASVFHPLATNFEHPYARTRFGLNLLYGRAGELDNGVQLGLVNVVAGKEGLATGNMSGVQLAPYFGLNYASGRANGLQIAWIGNAAGGGLEGGQISLGANVSGGDTTGTQAAFGANVSTGDVKGLQFAAVNVARDVDGAQVGFVNVARKLEGVAFGLINVADDIDGVPIGLVSVTRTGGVHPVVWGGSDTFANIGLKFATKHTYTMLAAHYTALGSGDYTTDGGRPLHLDAHDAVGGGFFLGGHVPIESAFIDFDLGFSSLASPARSIQTKADGTTRGYTEIVLESRVRVLAGYSFAEHASLFFGVGGTVRARIINGGDDAVVRPLADVFGGIQF